MLSVLAWLACAPVYKIPGSTASVGRDKVRTSGPWDAIDETQEAAPEAVVEAEPAPPARKTVRRGGKTGQRVADSAGHYVGRTRLKSDGESYRYDCSGLVDVSHARAGVDIGQKNSKALWALSDYLDVRHGRGDELAPGDVVFFDNTYDQDGNGKVDDPLSHVAVVESVAADGTATLVHKGSKGVVRIQMNLDHPDVALSPDGVRWNSWLRGRTRSDPKGTKYLSAELYAGSASFWRAEEIRFDAQVAQ
ncbi:MAG: C40 family peptidase [Proteobacteria bacterium]|nr:C40 family peptidase [Pseudomonadota bacterium]MCP4918106.1 C40 family peptidase [Pseudomonadota bacterium]